MKDDRNVKWRCGMARLSLVWLFGCLVGGGWLLSKGVSAKPDRSHQLHTKAIEDIRVGDYVIAKDPSSSTPAEPHKVVALHRNWTRHVFTVHVVQDGRAGMLEATGQHPFWVVNRGWVLTHDLKRGDHLKNERGSDVIVESVGEQQRRVKTFNLEVEGLHTYFACADRVPLLVHNGTPLDEPGHWNYRLEDENDVPYYNGRGGPNETVQDVRYRHETRSEPGGSSPGRFDPSSGDDLKKVPGSRTYEESRRMEHENTINDGTYVGKDGNNYRGNRQSPIGERNSDKYYPNGDYPECPK